MFLSCLCNCALFVCSSHVEEIKNIIIIIIKNIIIIIIKLAKNKPCAACGELNLIQIVPYIHPLQMIIKSLSVQMGTKMITRVPPIEIASATSYKKSFSHYASSFSFTIPVSSIIVRKTKRKQFSGYL